MNDKIIFIESRRMQAHILLKTKTKVIYELFNKL